MSGAGRGVTPGTEPDDNASSPVPGQGRPAGSAEGAQAAGGNAEAPAGNAGPAADGQTADGRAADGRAADGAGGAETSSARSKPAGSAGAGSAGAGSGTAGRGKRRKRSFWREFPILVVVALLLAVVIKTYAIQAFFIPSGSMQNTLEINDRVLVNKIVYHTRGIHRGDIVVFNGDGSWDPGTPPPSTNFAAEFVDGFASMFGFGHPGDILIKRVIGLPGDRVACCDEPGRVTVNGVPLNEQSYLYPGDAPSDARFNIVVPPGRLWVMGDHRSISDDSRDHLGDPGGGTIPESAVVGRAFIIIWPLSRWSILPIPATFQQPKLNASAAAAAPGPAADPMSARPEPSGPAIPLSIGFAAAIPVTWLQRRFRLRVARRRAERRGRRAGQAPDRPDPDGPCSA